MLTFEGKSFNYYKNKARDPPNKEASPNRFLLEKLYRVHRVRVIHAKPAVETHVHVPDFMKNALTAKEAAKDHALMRISKENETIYRRIARAENAESLITKETREHVKRVEHELVLMERLKRMGRARGVLRVNRENEDILMRIERARPEYTQKSLREWYKHHELFKKGRKSDPTAGHLGFRNMRGLMPTALPPVAFDTTLQGGQRSNVELAEERAKQLRGESLTLQTLNSTGSEYLSLDSPSSAASPYGSPMFSGKSGSSSPIKRSAAGAFNKMSHFDLSEGNMESSSYASTTSSAVAAAAFRSGGSKGGSQSPLAGATKTASAGSVSSTGVDAKSKSRKKNSPSGKKTPQSRPTSTSSPPLNPSSRAGSPAAAAAAGGLSLAQLKASENEFYGDDEDGEDSIFASIEPDPNYISLLCKMCSIPFEDTSVILQILVARTYEECVLLRLLNSAPPHEILVERDVEIDEAFEILNKYGSVMLNSDSMDLKSLRGQLIGLFQELDADKSGYLSFDEFSDLMSKSQVGIRSADLRNVLAEADENGDGVVQFAEFVPLAIDMIQAFRTKSQASKWFKLKESQLDEEVLRRMKRMDIASIVDAVLIKIAESDPKKTGSLRLSDLRKHLLTISSKVGLTDVEIAWIMKHASKVGMGRCRYDNIGELLTRSRFLLLKHGLLEETGTDVLKYLLAVCDKLAQEEEKNSSSSEFGFVPGMLPLHTLTQALRTNERYPITTLQASVLLSDDSSSQHVHEGHVDYYSALPVVAKSIEILRDPKTLRQRAELIDPLGVSLDSGAILAEKEKEREGGANTAKSLATASPSSPTDGRRGQGSTTATAASNSPNSPSSSSSRKSTIMSGSGGQSVLLSTPGGSKPATPGERRLTDHASSFERRLRSLFNSSDADRNGSLDDKEFTTALRALDLQLSDAEILIFKELADRDHNGEISFSEFCAFFAKNLAALERMKHMRLLHATLHQQGDEESSGLDMDQEHLTRELTDHLLSVFRLSDPDRTGTVDIHVMENIITSLDIDISDFQIDTLLSDASLDSAGQVNYQVTIPIFVDMLRLFLSEQGESAEKARFDEEASRRAHEITLASAVEIYAIVSFIYSGLLNIDQDVEEEENETRYDNIRALLNSPHSGLAHSEATFLLVRLFKSTDSVYESQCRQEGLANLPVSEAHTKAFADRINHRIIAGKNRRQKVTHLGGGGLGDHHYHHDKNRASTRRSFATKRDAHEIARNVRRATCASLSVEADTSSMRAHQPTPWRSLQEVTDAVFDARKLKVQRGILQSMPVKAIEKVLYSSLLHCRDVLAMQGKCPHNSVYLPIRDCFVVLEESRHFRLTRPQIMGVVSWAECHDQTNTLIDFAAFSTYAAGMIKKLQSSQTQETRAKLVRMMSTGVGGVGGGGAGGGGANRMDANADPEHIIAQTALNGLTEEELESFLVESFTNVQSVEETVDDDVFVDILTRIPCLRLSEKEARTVAATFPRTDAGTVYWPEFIPFARNTFVSLCLERLLARRMVLGGASMQPRNVRAGRSGAGGGSSSSSSSSSNNNNNTMIISNTDALEEAVEGEEGEERSREAIVALRKLAAGIVDHLEVRVSGNERVVVLLPGETVEDDDSAGDAGSAEDLSIASLDSLESIALEQLPSPAIRSILQRRKPNEMRLQLDEVDGLGMHHWEEEHFEASNTGVSGVALFDATVDLALLIVKTGAATNRNSTTSRATGGGGGGGNAAGDNTKASPGPSPSVTPVLQRRKTFVAPTAMAEPPNSRSISVRLCVLCAEAEVLTFDRSLIVTASRASAGAVLVPPNPSMPTILTKTIPVPPFDAVCAQTVRLPSICLVDAAAAREFAAGLAEQLYLEVADSGKVLGLKMKDVEYFTNHL